MDVCAHTRNLRRNYYGLINDVAGLPFSCSFKFLLTLFLFIIREYYDSLLNCSMRCLFSNLSLCWYQLCTSFVHFCQRFHFFLCLCYFFYLSLLLCRCTLEVSHSAHTYSSLQNMHNIETNYNNTTNYNNSKDGNGHKKGEKYNYNAK